ncbi:protein HEXIM1 [Pectinophora gossypiella]|uniref:protein HEXIM1 n=1 Tax=Pectinophora gossypiella TaxID=13191 RepID=UPI00214EB483|nr:protein HEXIM1 [Pectinophora gossypiella]
MDVNNAEIKDGDQTRPSLSDAPSIVELPNPIIDGSGKKKRRRGKSKRKIMKPFMKAPWQDRRKNDKTKRNNRFRKIVLAKTHAPFNNNQFLMEIHKPEPENNFNRTPARTRDSSFSVDSEDNYFFSLPEDEEEYLTKEFSSVYEDAQSERLSNMSKTELIQEYLLLEAKYDNLMKRTERSKPRYIEEERGTPTERDTSVTDRDSMMTDRDTSATSNDSSTAGDTSVDALMRHVKEQEAQIRELQLTNEQLRLENETLQQRIHNTSSEDSESDSSSTTSGSSSSSSSNTGPSMSPEPQQVAEVNNDVRLSVETQNNLNGTIEGTEPAYPLVNGFHNPTD